MAKKKNKNKVAGGKKAGDRGKEVEAALEIELADHARYGLLAFDKTYPQVTMINRKTFVNGQFKWEKQLSYTGKGGPDWIITLGTKLTRAKYGVSVWLETKHVSDSPNTGRMTRIHQYRDLLSNAYCGGLSGYLVLWRVNATATGSRGVVDEWRYHPVLPTGDHPSVVLDTIKTGKNAGGEVVYLHREHGILVNHWSNGLFDALGSEFFDDVWQKEVPTPKLIETFKKLYFSGGF